MRDYTCVRCGTNKDTVDSKRDNSVKIWRGTFNNMGKVAEVSVRTDREAHGVSDLDRTEKSEKYEACRY